MHLNLFHSHLKNYKRKNKIKSLKIKLKKSRWKLMKSEKNNSSKKWRSYESYKSNYPNPNRKFSHLRNNKRSKLNNN